MKINPNGGLATLCKRFGMIEVHSKGEIEIWVWDYKINKPRPKSEMTEKEIAANEKLMYNQKFKKKKP